MLQNLRESMTGVVAKVIVGLVIAAMVLFGVESLFVNSVGGNEVATVNGDDISNTELLRAIEQQKSRLRQQFQLEDDNEMLSDERLRAPALMNLVRQKALQQAAENAGMNVSPDIIKEELVKAFTRDGEFDAALMNNYIAGYGYTPATLAQSEANAYILRQLFGGLSQTEFVTKSELDAMAAIAGQKRSFATVEINKEKVGEDVTISDDQIQAYYDANAAEFTDSEKIALEYVEVSASALASSQEVSEEEVKSEYEREQLEFESRSETHVSHILIQDNDENRIAEVSKKLAEGMAFDALAKESSDDLGSKALGGQLGQIIEGAFPSEFEEAANALVEGEVSAPIKTDAGTHFIRLDKKVVTEMPSFDSRKGALLAMLQEQKAVTDYLEKVQMLEEVSFGASDLVATADAVGGEVQATPLFSRGQGIGLAAEAAVSKAAFEDDVYLQGQNSRVLELPGERAVVIRLKNKVAAKLRPLADVKAGIEKNLKIAAIESALQELAKDVVAVAEIGGDLKASAEEKSYQFAEFSDIERTSADVDFLVSREAFSMVRPAEGEVVTSTVSTQEGLTILVLNRVVSGAADELPKEQRDAMEQQLRSQVAAGSVKAFEDRVFESADYIMN